VTAQTKPQVRSSHKDLITTRQQHRLRWWLHLQQHCRQLLHLHSPVTAPDHNPAEVDSPMHIASNVRNLIRVYFAACNPAIGRLRVCPTSPHNQLLNSPRYLHPDERNLPPGSPQIPHTRTAQSPDQCHRHRSNSAMMCQCSEKALVDTPPSRPGQPGARHWW